MKTKDLFSITLKIIGLIAFWKCIQTFGTMISGVGALSFLFENNSQMNTSFLLTMVLAMLLNFVLPLIVAIVFLFKTGKIVSLININELGNINLNLDKLVIYHMIVVVLGFVVILDGAGNFIEFKYNTDTKTEYTTGNVSSNSTSENSTPQKKIFVTDSKNTNVNFIALIELILGIVLLANATDVARKMERSFDAQPGLQQGESSN